MHVLTFDSVVSFLNVVVLDLQQGPNAQPGARVRVARSALVQVATDWHSDVELFTVQNGQSDLILRGTVQTSREANNDAVELEIRSWPDVLEDIGAPGIVVKDAPRADAVWSVIMTSGIGSDSLSVEGLSELPLEEFRVVVPVYGAVVTRHFQLDNVEWLPSPGPPPIDVPAELEELADLFRICGGVVVASVSARTLFEAEQEGIAEIDYSLGSALLTRRSAYMDAGSSARPSFSRTQTLSIFGRYPVVAVLGRWGRTWLRGTTEAQVAGDPGWKIEQEPLELPAFRGVPRTLTQAITSWRRAIEEGDRVAKVLALWEAIEFYVAGTKSPRLFTRSDISQIKDRAAVGLTEEQVERLQDVGSFLNSPSMMFKLQQAARNDGVSLSAANLSVLGRLRSTRNDIVHGRAWTVPAHSDLRKGLGIVNNLLLTRLRNLNDSKDSQREAERHAGNSSSHTEGADVATRKPSETFTQNAKEWAQQAAESMMLMIPYLERGDLVPGPIHSRVRDLYSGATEESLVVGMMRACDVAVKHLSRHFSDGDLERAAVDVQATLDQVRSADLAGFGHRAYDDGSRAIELMTEAMVQRGSIRFLDEFETVERTYLALNAFLIALLLSLAGKYGIPPSRAAAQLGQEISTIIPKDA